MHRTSAIVTVLVWFAAIPAPGGEGARLEDVVVGIHNILPIDAWMPLKAFLSNPTGRAFSGTLRIQGDVRGKRYIHVPVTIPPRTRLTLYGMFRLEAEGIPPSKDRTSSLTAVLVSNGAVMQHLRIDYMPIDRRNAFVVMGCGDETGFMRPLDGEFFKEEGRTFFCTGWLPKEAPAFERVWMEADAVTIDGGPTWDTPSWVRDAIHSYVRSGGLLVLSPSSVPSMEQLAAWLPLLPAEPVAVHRMNTVEIDGFGRVTDAKNGIRFLECIPTTGTVVLYAGGLPLVTRKRVGLGTVVMVSLDMNAPAVRRWKHFDAFCRYLLSLYDGPAKPSEVERAVLAKGAGTETVGGFAIPPRRAVALFAAVVLLCLGAVLRLCIVHRSAAAACLLLPAVGLAAACAGEMVGRYYRHTSTSSVTSIGIVACRSGVRTAYVVEETCIGIQRKKVIRPAFRGDGTAWYPGYGDLRLQVHDGVETLPTTVKSRSICTFTAAGIVEPGGEIDSSVELAPTGISIRVRNRLPLRLDGGFFQWGRFSLGVGGIRSGEEMLIRPGRKATGSRLPQEGLLKNGALRHRILDIVRTSAPPDRPLLVLFQQKMRPFTTTGLRNAPDTLHVYLCRPEVVTKGNRIRIPSGVSIPHPLHGKATAEEGNVFSGTSPGNLDLAFRLPREVPRMKHLGVKLSWRFHSIGCRAEMYIGRRSGNRTFFERVCDATTREGITLGNVDRFLVRRGGGTALLVRFKIRPRGEKRTSEPTMARWTIEEPRIEWEGRLEEERCSSRKD